MSWRFPRYVQEIFDNINNHESRISRLEKRTELLEHTILTHMDSDDRHTRGINE